MCGAGRARGRSAPSAAPATLGKPCRFPCIFRRALKTCGWDGADWIALLGGSTMPFILALLFLLFP